MKGNHRRGARLALLIMMLVPTLLVAQIQAPTLGYVLDPAISAIRPILGIPGASILGKPIDLGLPIDYVAFSADPNSMLALSEHHPILLVRDSLGRLSHTPLTATSYKTDRIVLSPTGSAAALIDTAGSATQVIAGLPENPYVSRVAELPSVYGSLTFLAVSDNAAFMLTAFSDSNAVFLLTSDSVRPIGAFGQVTAMTFLHERPDALIADGLYNEVYLVRDVPGLAGKALLAESISGISGPVGIAASGDNRRFYVANAESAEIVILDPTNPPERVTCHCQPTGLHPLRTDGVFRLTTTPADEPFWVFDGRTLPARTIEVLPISNEEGLR